MRHKIFNYMKTYQGFTFIFNVSGGSFFKGQRKFPRKPALSPNKWKLFKFYIWGLNTSFEGFFWIFLPVP